MLTRNDLHQYQEYCVSFVEEHPESLLILEKRW